MVNVMRIIITKILKKFLSLFKFIPWVNRFFDRKYSHMGIGLYFLNSIVKRIFRINKGDYLVHFSSRLNQSKNVKVGEGENKHKVYLSFALSGGCYYQAYNGIEIGAGSIWAFGCKFVSTNHSFSNYTKPTKGEPIRLGKNVWLGSNVVILPEVQIGDYAVIGAGAVVTKDIKAYEIAVGNPAKVIAKRCTKCLDKIPLKSKDPVHLCKHQTKEEYKD